MSEIQKFRNCWSVLASNTIVSLNDNLAKYVILGLCGALMSQSGFERLNSQIALLLVLPYILFAPVAGWVSDRFCRRRVLGVTVLAQFIGLGSMSVGLLTQSLSPVLAGLFLLSVQSIFFSPARYGILKDLVGRHKLGLAIAWTELLVMMAVLMGGFLGGLFFAIAENQIGDPWRGALWVVAGIAGLGALSWVILQGTPRVSSGDHERPLFRWGILVGHFSDLLDSLRSRGLRLAMLGFAWFLGVAWLVLLCLAVIAKGVAEPEKVGQLTGLFSLFLGFGTILGCGFTGYINRGRVELGTVALGAIGIVISLICTGLSIRWGWVEFGNYAWVFRFSLLALGFSGAIFSVPLRGYMLDVAGEAQRGRVIASSTLLSNLFGLLFIGLHFWMLRLGISPGEQFLLMVIPSVLVMGYVLVLLPEALFRTLVLILTRLVYRLKISGAEQVPETGGVLLIANHVSYADPVMIGAACPRRVRFIGFSGLTKSKWMKWLFRFTGVIPVSKENAREAISKASEALKAGEVVCIFPEGAISRTGGMQGLKRGFELIARKAKAAVVPVNLDGMWGSIFSYERNCFFKKTPLRLPYPVSIHFGDSMTTDNVNSATARQSMLDLNEEAFSKRCELEEHLGYAIFKALRDAGSQEIIVDRTADRQTMRADVLLAMSLAFAEELKGMTSSRRVGIALPPGVGAAVANLGCVFADKVPVNLNFSLGEAALESCIQRAEMDSLLSADTMMKRFPALEKVPRYHDIKQKLTGISRLSVGLKLMMAKAFPQSVSAGILGVPRRGGEQEAALIFTSGSSGEPKGVMLSHRNLLGNLFQMADCNLLDRDAVVLGNLPLFHSFGFLVTLWYPILHGLRLVTVPSPLEVKKSITAIEEEKVSILLGTPTFLRPILLKAKPEQLSSVEVALAGAERTPAGIARKWEEKFGSIWLEGYGLTETSPVVSVNLPDPPSVEGESFKELGRRPGSVGRPLPGIALRFVDPDTGEELPFGETGILKVRGPNVFRGYLNDPDRSGDVLEDGWFTTGDLARLDEEGFLHIEGRRSRFSKIGGEMVPHGTVEEAIQEALQLEPSEEPALVITGLEDEVKGEVLVLLTVFECDPAELRSKLSEAGLANLWIPKVVKQVPKIPVLSTGKFDLKAIQDLAKEA